MPNGDTKASQYQVGGFELTVFNQAYLVEVKAVSNRSADAGMISGLPEWVFRSSHAIWLTDDEAALEERALKGDEIKQALIEQIGAARCKGEPGTSTKQCIG